MSSCPELKEAMSILLSNCSSELSQWNSWNGPFWMLPKELLNHILICAWIESTKRSFWTQWSLPVYVYTKSLFWMYQLTLDRTGWIWPQCTCLTAPNRSSRTFQLVWLYPRCCDWVHQLFIIRCSLQWQAILGMSGMLLTCWHVWQVWVCPTADFIYTLINRPIIMHTYVYICTHRKTSLWVIPIFCLLCTQQIVFRVF